MAEELARRMQRLEDDYRRTDDLWERFHISQRLQRLKELAAL